MKVNICSSDRYMIHLYCLAVQAGFYSDVVECWPVKQMAWVRSPAAALVIRILSPVTSGANMGPERLGGLRLSACSNWDARMNLKMEGEYVVSKNGGGIWHCSSDRYMIHLYCRAIQAGFYSDVVECWPVTQTAQVRSSAAALVIRILSPVTSGTQRVAWEAWWPEIEWLLILRFAHESENGGGICSI